MADSEVKKVVRAARKQGFTVEQLPSRHWRISRGEKSVTLASTPSDHRSTKNAIAQLRRELGFQYGKHANTR